MSAQSFYDQAVAVPQTYRVENTSYAPIANNEVPAYFQTIRCGRQLRIMYWFFYGYQSACDAFGNGTHNGDWEKVMVTLSEDEGSIAAVTYYMHGKRYTRLAARGGFSWGYDGVGTHPTIEGPSCDMNAADWSFEVPTWWHSQCKVGDDDTGTWCVQQCESGYDQYPLTCTHCSGFWPWEWSCSTYNRHNYQYDWTLPTSDLGLLVDDP